MRSIPSSAMYLEGVSVLGPGLPDWETAAELLCAQERYKSEPEPAINLSALGSGTRRRTSEHMQVAIQAAGKIIEQFDVDQHTVKLILATTEVDLFIYDKISQSLCQESKPVSPQQFQNTILHAAASHLGIHLKNISGATTVTGAENSFAVGLLQTYAYVQAEQKDALFIAYDAPGPGIFGDEARDRSLFSVGMLFKASASSKTLRSLNLSLVEETHESSFEPVLLESLRNNSSAARSLPLLSAIANDTSCPINLPYSDQLKLQVNLQ